MTRMLKISVRDLQTKLHMNQAVGVSKIGDMPAVFVILRRDDAPPEGETIRLDALTPMSSERAREMALALWEAAKECDQLDTERKEGE